MSLLASQVLLYAPGPFFFYPWKASANNALGSPYHNAIRHFYRDHSVGLNLTLHTLAAFLQLTANLAFTRALASLATTTTSYATLTPTLVTLALATQWAVYLGRCSAPRIAGLGSAAVLLGLTTALLFHPFFAQSASLAGRLEETTLVGFSVAICLSIFTGRPSARRRRAIAALLFSAAAAAWHALTHSPTLYLYLRSVAVASSLSPLQQVGCLLLTLVLLAAPANPATRIAVLGTLATRALSLALSPAAPSPPLVFSPPADPADSPTMTDEACLSLSLTLLSLAYLGMFLQGVSHKVVQQQPTLIALEKQKDRSAAKAASSTSGASPASLKVAFEWAHVTYFPALLLHTILITLGLLPKRY